MRAAPARGAGRLGVLAGALVVLGALASACQERLTSPGECPQLCPGGEVRTVDVVLTPRTGLDSTFTGYNSPTTAFALLVSNGLAGAENRAAYRMAARQDTVMVDDTARSYTVDSVALTVTVVARDTLVDGLKLILYRISDTVNATATFPSLDPQLIPANVIDTLVVPDTMGSRGGTIRTVLRGADLAKVDLPIAGNGILALGVSLTADQPTGARLGSARAGNGIVFTNYLTADVADTAIRKQTRALSPTFNTYVTQTPVLPDPRFLTVGGDSASRTLLRFALPAEVTDSANIVRATLELVPRGLISGLRGDIAILEGRAVLADLGAKSPVVSNDNPSFIVDDTVAVNSSDTVKLNVTRIVQLWQSSTSQPDAIFLSLLPEASTFTRAEFGSTRSDPTINPAATEPLGAPRLRITYQRPFPFENP